MAITEVACSSRTARKIDLVVVARPVGPLAHAIDAYRQAVAVRVGKNGAHLAPPHCPLARCYSDHPSSVHLYQRALAATLQGNRGHLVQPGAIMVALTTNRGWHRLEIQAPPLVALAAEFVARTTSPARGHHVRLEDSLRLVLAIDFETADHEAVSELAHRIVDPSLPTEWEVGLWHCDDHEWGSVWRERAR